MNNELRIKPVFQVGKPGFQVPLNQSSSQVSIRTLLLPRKVQLAMTEDLSLLITCCCAALCPHKGRVCTNTCIPQLLGAPDASPQQRDFR